MDKLVQVYHLYFPSVYFSRSVSTPGSLWAHKPIFDNKVVSSVSAKAYHDVTHPITCMATCPPNSTCNAVFYSESEVKCVTCPYPCQQASLVTASGFRFYGPQRGECWKKMLVTADVGEFSRLCWFCGHTRFVIQYKHVTSDISKDTETHNQCCLSWDWSWYARLSLSMYTRTHVHTHAHTHTHTHSRTC